MEFIEKKGVINIHNPDHGIFVEGKPGSGKSASIIEPCHYNAINQGMSGLIYDFKGHPMSLGKSAYNYWHYAPKEIREKVQMKFLNYVDPLLGCKTNILSKEIISSNLSLSSTIEILYKNLEKEWIKKTDFWANNAIAYGKGVAMFIRDYFPQFTDFGHFLALSLTDFDIFLEAVLQHSDNVQLNNIMKPLITAYKQNAEGQLAGTVSTTQLPLTKMDTKEILWVHSSKDEKEYVSLDVSNKKHPTIMILCNHKPISPAISPSLSVMGSQIMDNINRKGNNPSLFSSDELPTWYIQDLDVLPATARSNKVVTILAIQTFSQLVDTYGRDKALKIRDNLGNVFIGRCGMDSAKDYAALFGKVKQVNQSQGKSSNGTSTNTNLAFEDVLQMRDIAGQNIGHFLTQISGGKPPFSFAQYDYFDFEKATGNKEIDVPIQNIPEPFEQSYQELLEIKNPKERERELEDFKDLLLQYFEEKQKENYNRVYNNVKEFMLPFEQLAIEKRAKN